MDILCDDQAIQQELEILWGDRLSALTPKQRKMVAEILKQDRRFSKYHINFKQSTSIANSQANICCYSCC